jgi:hypothetical protein
MTDEAMSPLRRCVIEDTIVRKIAPKGLDDAGEPNQSHRCGMTAARQIGLSDEAVGGLDVVDAGKLQLFRSASG